MAVLNNSTIPIPFDEKMHQEEILGLRKSFSKLVNTKAENIIISPSICYSMTLAAKNIVNSGTLKRGKKIIVFDKENELIVSPWKESCEVSHSSIEVIKDRMWTDAILREINDTVAVIVIPAIHSWDGSVIDIRRICSRLSELPINNRPMLIVDATQAIGIMIHRDVYIFHYVSFIVHELVLSLYLQKVLQNLIYLIWILTSLLVHWILGVMDLLDYACLI